MSERDFYDSLLEIGGSQPALTRFTETHLARATFSFNSVVPMPLELDFDLNNFVEDGYDALFGNWRNLVERWMFKPAAAERGYPFPLETRDQVLECIAALGEYGDERFRLGRQFKSNLDRHGHGHCSSWRLEKWGIDNDVAEVVVEQTGDCTRIAFETYGAPPKKLFLVVSAANPDLTFELTYLSEWGKRPKRCAFIGGEQRTRPPLTTEACKAVVWGFRRRAGLTWLRRTLVHPELIDLLEMNERGRAMLKGADMALNFALHRAAQGESPEELARRFPKLEARHVEALRELVGAQPRVPADGLTSL